MTGRGSPASSGTGLHEAAAAKQKLTADVSRPVRPSTVDAPHPLRPTLDPECAYIGALLCQLHPEPAVRLAGLVLADDLRDPRLRLVHGLVADLSGAGTVADPAAVLGAAQRTGQVTGAHALAGLGELLSSLYAGCPFPASAGHYAGLVLDLALRRRCQEAAERIGQAAESTGLGELVSVFGSELLAVVRLRDRRADVLSSLGLDPAQEVAA